MVVTNNALHNFKAIITELYVPENTVIGGIHALLLHGLQMSRIPADLDLVLYNPTGKQLNALKYFRHFDCIKDRPAALAAYDETNIKAYKIKKNDTYLDLIVEHQIQTPSDLLVFSSNIGFNFFVQSVEGVMAAKRSYFHEAHHPDDKEMYPFRKYIRGKDALDCIDLKNSNFNL